MRCHRRDTTLLQVADKIKVLARPREEDAKKIVRVGTVPRAVDKDRLVGSRHRRCNQSGGSKELRLAASWILTLIQLKDGHLWRTFLQQT